MTYSIVARDKTTGELGVAVQSHYFSVGSVVTWARPGVGAVATQSITEPSYGPLGLDLMAGGKSAPEALSALKHADPKVNVRQVGMVDAKGLVASHTGEKCIPFAGHVLGDGFACQANLMRNDTIWGAMRDAYVKFEDLPLAERLVEALAAGEEAGGDVRGKQSSALLVVGGELTALPWSGHRIELRVEDDPDPIGELKRLLRYKRGYDWVDRGDELLTSHKSEQAIEAYEKALAMVPEVDELRYWVGISLLGAGHKERGMAMTKEVIAKDPSYVGLTRSVVRIGMVILDKEVLAELLGQPEPPKNPSLEETIS